MLPLYTSEDFINPNIENKETGGAFLFRKLHFIEQTSKTEESIRTSTCTGAAFDGSGALQSYIDANIQSALERN
ncbi:hypothetical protein WUBG_02863 [Wuchereria bancrofti]|uniref:Uncharacterized protein n=1 Tax=Wuchereria bancrofti TaxID=6293 RepID=J9EUG6_WUCBA|nr:hypothetical protein WUBG_02863 [Wuchereria bancrofti]VDM18817.1 unnamed protein product [Wuchereria bancrofti]